MAFDLAIRTPTGPIFAGEVVSLIAPGATGSLGVLAHHAPLITSLQAGELEATLPDGTVRAYFVTGGFLEVSRNRAIVLADAIETAETLDARAAGEELETLRKERPAAPDPARAEQEIARARARLRAARRKRGEMA